MLSGQILQEKETETRKKGNRERLKRGKGERVNRSISTLYLYSTKVQIPYSFFVHDTKQGSLHPCACYLEIHTGTYEYIPKEWHHPFPIHPFPTGYLNRWRKEKGNNNEKERKGKEMEMEKTERPRRHRDSDTPSPPCSYSIQVVVRTVLYNNTVQLTLGIASGVAWSDGEMEAQRWKDEMRGWETGDESSFFRIPSSSVYRISVLICWMRSCRRRLRCHQSGRGPKREIVILQDRRTKGSGDQRIRWFRSSQLLFSHFSVLFYLEWDVWQCDDAPLQIIQSPLRLVFRWSLVTWLAD